MIRIGIALLMLLAGVALAGPPVDRRLTTSVIPTVEFRDVNPIDAINGVVSLVLAANPPDISISPISNLATESRPLHSSIHYDFDKNELPHISIARTNITALALILEIAETANITIVCTTPRQMHLLKRDSNRVPATD